jgi:hypothetical protein
VRRCDVCGDPVERRWWWRCEVHDVTECDGCSIPGATDRPYEDSSHRFRCKAMNGIGPDGTFHFEGDPTATEIEPLYGWADD